MRRLGLTAWLLTLGSIGTALGAAPAAPTYIPIEQTIDRVQRAWQAHPDANAPGWNAYFDGLRREFRTFAAAGSDNDRLVSLNRIYQMTTALSAVSWAPAQELRGELRNWLRPRIRLAWAERRLVDSVHGLAMSPDPAVQANRQHWIRFAENDLGSALQGYEAAETVAARLEALRRVYSALNALDARNRARPWVPSLELEQAVNDLHNRPNLDVTADVATLSPVFNQNLVTNEPIYRNGYVTYVTPGQKTGFGLLPSDSGIAFYNSQLLATYTPISDFQQQVENTKQGRRAARLYYFAAASQDCSELTVTALLSPNGLSLNPSYRHNVNAAITTYPEAGGGFGRFVASVIGLNQARITQMAYDRAIGQIQQSVVKESAELGRERTDQQAAQQNAKLRQYLIGNNMLAIRNLLITGLTLRSQPTHALIGGTLNWANAGLQVGADAPEPSRFLVPNPGVTADVHLGSIMTSLARGYLQSDRVRSLQNLMIETRKVPPNAPPRQGIVTSQNVDFPTYLRAIETARASNDPKVMAVRIKRPGVAPEFAADANGNLVALIHDFQIEVPAPPQAARGGLAGPPANVYRITSPESELVISFKVTAATAREPVRLSGRIQSFDPGPNARVFAINQDENQPAQLTAFASSLILSVFRSKIQGQPIDAPLSNLQLRGFAINQVSDLDPSGWIRVNLVRTSASPAAGVQ